MIEVSFDISKWLAEMGVAEKRIKHVAETVFKEAADIIYENAVNFTPVGNPSLWKRPEQVSPFYEPGHLKESWSLTFNGNTIAILSNDAIYALRVENGWSSQAPNGMLKRAIALYPSIIDNLGIKYKL